MYCLNYLWGLGLSINDFDCTNWVYLNIDFRPFLLLDDVIKSLYPCPSFTVRCPKTSVKQRGMTVQCLVACVEKMLCQKSFKCSMSGPSLSAMFPMSRLNFENKTFFCFATLMPGMYNMTKPLI